MTVTENGRGRPKAEKSMSAAERKRKSRDAQRSVVLKDVSAAGASALLEAYARYTRYEREEPGKWAAPLVSVASELLRRAHALSEKVIS